VTPAARRPLVIGNWKMHLDHFEAIAHTQRIAYSLRPQDTGVVDVAVLPPFPDLRSVQTLVDADALPLAYGAQDLSPHDSGAYTGDVSGRMLARLGCTYVTVGHSERRTLHGEDDALVAAKTQAALRHGLVPVVCVGETLEVRRSGGHVALVSGQVEAVLSCLPAERWGDLVLAYEPVWAIGTGEVASAQDAAEMAGAIRGAFGTSPAASVIRVLYGGSVKAANAAELLTAPDVDGALVGGASLDAGEFAAIVRAAAGERAEAG
jgi:triosephosphate isomerase